MTNCAAQIAGATGGVAAALRSVDCLASETTASAFARLFGGSGALMPVLTTVLTLYIGFFALALLTGRSRIGIAALTPRMLTLGLALTFATSWVAYQSVVWNLAIGGPDQIAGVLMGTQGSATALFGERIDIIFEAIAQVDTAAGNGQGAANVGTFSPTGLMWLAAVLLLLATVGVLVTARIALAVLLALGPIFVILSLFNGTRGLFVGWLRGVVLTATTPLFAVLGGGLMLELAVPVIAGLQTANGIDGRASMALFLIAAVHVALMSLVIRVTTTIVSAWQVFGLANEPGANGDAPQVAPNFAVNTGSANAAPFDRSKTMRLIPSAMAISASNETARPRAIIAGIADIARSGSTRSQPDNPNFPQPNRARGIGSRFRACTVHSRELTR